MSIRTCGDETALLSRILGESRAGSDVVVPNGDDAAVCRFGGELVAVTTDTVVEGRHFTRQLSSLADVGSKAIEAAASDIVAMGGRPRHLYLGLSIRADSPVDELEEIYRGIRRAADRIGAVVLGGDTTVGTEGIVLTVTVVGVIQSESHLSTRSGAKPGDLLCVSGPLGGAAAGLKALLERQPGYENIKIRHRAPTCRIDCIDLIAPIATSMIDVSDGLSSEVHHICRMSCVGATIEAGRIPLEEETMMLGRAVGGDPIEWALSGGDDYELLYTVKPHDREKVHGTVIGVVTAERRITIEHDGVVTELLNRGYDHLRQK